MIANRNFRIRVRFSQRADDQVALWALGDIIGIHTCPYAQHLAEFTKANFVKLAKDVDGNLVCLADTWVNLMLALERWPKVAFHDTREHGQAISWAL